MEKYIKNGSTSLANVRDHTNVENPNSIEIRSFPPPTIVAQPRFVNQRARFVKNYALSVYGLVRVIIILLQMAALIAVASSPKLFNGRLYMPVEFFVTRDVFLFFSISGFLLALGIWTIYSFNINNGWFFNRLPLVLLIIGTDLLWMIPMFVLGIVAAYRESILTNPNFIDSSDINKGAFGAASAFAFLVSLFYGIDCVLYFYKSCNGGVEV